MLDARALHAPPRAHAPPPPLASLPAAPPAALSFGVPRPRSRASPRTTSAATHSQPTQSPQARGERQARSSGDVGDERVTNAFARKDSKPPQNGESPVRGYSHATHATNPMANKAKIFP
jgi:hypothetical protein